MRFGRKVALATQALRWKICSVFSVAIPPAQSFVSGSAPPRPFKRSESAPRAVISEAFSAGPYPDDYLLYNESPFPNPTDKLPGPTEYGGIEVSWVGDPTSTNAENSGHGCLEGAAFKRAVSELDDRAG